MIDQDRKPIITTLNETFDSPLDKGIEPIVLILRKHGIETFESCQGGDGHCFPDPTVRFEGEYNEGFRAYSIALANGLKVDKLRRVYSHQDNELKGPWWEMTFVIK